MDRSNNCPYQQFQKDQGVPQSQGYNPGAPGPGYNPGAPGPGYNPGAPGPGYNPGAPGPGYNPGAPGPGYNPLGSFSTNETNPGISKIGMTRVTESEAPGHYNMNNNVNYNRQMTVQAPTGAHQIPSSNQNPYPPPNPQNSNRHPMEFNQPPNPYNNTPPNPPLGSGGYYPGPGSGNV
jgi:hypothetical protein